MNSLGSISFAALALAVACRGEPRQPDTMSSLVDSLKPAVERAVGLRFKAPLKVATRNREQLRAYLLQKIDEELPPERLRGSEYVYRLLGLVPDTLDLNAFLVSLLTEQVAGFYDPKTSTLYGIEGSDHAQLALMAAHEMVHGLQHQYLPLDSILEPQADDDRQVAAQAILEGQATLVSLRVLLPDSTKITPEMWSMVRETMGTAQASMPLFAAAPLVIREQLLFPYLSGADFMIWWANSAERDTLPYGPRMPRSSEQILQPMSYATGDEPVALRFSAPDTALFENTLGDLDLRILAAQQAGAQNIALGLRVGWGGDRFRVYETPGGPALVWYIVWDNQVAADRFQHGTGAALAERSRPGYRTDLASLVVDGAPATRIVIAPTSWSRWQDLPTVTRTGY